MTRIIAFLSAIAVSAALSAACSCTTNDSASLKVLVGTYTEGTGSPGAYLLDFNQKDASWKVLDTAAAVNPSFIIPSEDRRHAYSVGECADGRQCAYSYRLDGSSIDVLNCVSTDGQASGAAPCNVVLSGGCLVTSNYRGGTLSAFPVAEDGTLGALAQQFVPVEGGPGTVHHMHCAIVSPDGRYLFATDLGGDAVYRFKVGEPGAPFGEPEVAWQFDTAEHPGPRHMVFSGDGRFAYLVHELGDLLTVFSYQDGRLEHLSTEPAYQGEGHGSADIHISPDGRFLYTSHRLKEDGLSIFRINREDGSVENAGYCRTGVHPRNFAITPNGRYLLCACRDSDAIEIYGIDSESGLLTFSGKTIEIPAPVCVTVWESISSSPR